MNLLRGDVEHATVHRAWMYTNYGIWLETNGWHVEPASQDHILATHLNGDYWKVQIWNGRDPRPEIRATLDLPVTVLD